MKLQRNDIIAIVVGTALGALALFGKIDWAAAVAWLIGLLQRQPSVISVPQQPQIGA